MKDLIPSSPVDTKSESAGLFQVPDMTALLGHQRMPRQKGTTQRRPLENREAKVHLGIPGHCSSAMQQHPMQTVSLISEKRPRIQHPQPSSPCQPGET